MEPGKSVPTAAKHNVKMNWIKTTKFNLQIGFKVPNWKNIWNKNKMNYIISNLYISCSEYKTKNNNVSKQFRLNITDLNFKVSLFVFQVNLDSDSFCHILTVTSLISCISRWDKWFREKWNQNNRESRTADLAWAL